LGTFALTDDVVHEREVGGQGGVEDDPARSRLDRLVIGTVEVSGRLALLPCGFGPGRNRAVDFGRVDFGRVDVGRVDVGRVDVDRVDVDRVGPDRVEGRRQVTLACSSMSPASRAWRTSWRWRKIRPSPRMPSLMRVR